MPTAPVLIAVPGTSSSPTAPVGVQPGGSTYNAWGSLLKTFQVTGFTADAASMNVDYLPASPGSVLFQYSPEVDTANSIGYVTDRWIINGVDNVSVSEDKAELVTADSTSPIGEYTGLNDQAGDTVTVGFVAPVTITVPGA